MWVLHTEVVPTKEDAKVVPIEEDVKPAKTPLGEEVG